MADVSSTDLISNWSTLIENLEASPLAFFETIEEGVKKRAVPDIDISRVDYRESGILSAKREYLRITRERLIFDMCASPYGTGFFVSWWLGTPSSSFDPIKTVALVVGYFIVSAILLKVMGAVLGFLLAVMLIPLTPVIVAMLGSADVINDDFMLGIPILGRLYKKFFKPDTYYAIDSATMFQTATHSAVLEAVDGLMTARGLRILSESDRKPTLRNSGRK